MQARFRSEVPSFATSMPNLFPLLLVVLLQHDYFPIMFDTSQGCSHRNHYVNYEQKLVQNGQHNHLKCCFRPLEQYRSFGGEQKVQLQEGSQPNNDIVSVQKTADVKPSPLHVSLTKRRNAYNVAQLHSRYLRICPRQYVAELPSTSDIFSTRWAFNGRHPGTCAC